MDSTDYLAAVSTDNSLFFQQVVTAAGGAALTLAAVIARLRWHNRIRAFHLVGEANEDAGNALAVFICLRLGFPDDGAGV